MNPDTKTTSARNLVLTNIAIVVLAVVLDQAVKALVVATMDLGEAIPILPFLALLHARNTGIAFSMFSDIGPMGLALLACVVLVAVFYLWIKTPVDRTLTHIALAIVVGGAIGNLIDRVWLGYVVDYVFFHTPLFEFAVFNLADSFISVGAALIVLDELILHPLRERRARRRSSTD
ncbi:signal peptidase II [Fulvimarina sp. 2208YS6-2-32]|uniref:Lipoprotein signal peptidase n=1 Tax=Fulvimarina uroteuthidis TaxID=3098149 RepID=A0ABU5HZ90_9HYPH|nr:signal peptidase II [Fulvimarina sp. 2208YS6-2-32]MDY8108115.1 signal peptidase II [Fulvimarina sp. 2208YS6-2-32]